MPPVAQELSALNPHNSSYRGDDGEAWNGWGLLHLKRPLAELAMRGIAQLTSIFRI
jgi:hypothetical protein